MQRIITYLSIFAFLFAMVLNIGLFMRANTLQQQVVGLAVQLKDMREREDQSETITQLKEQLDKAEDSRIKAERAAKDLSNQIAKLNPAAQERDTLRYQMQLLQQENNDLRNQIVNLEAMNQINGQVIQMRGLSPRSPVPRQFMNHAQFREYLTKEMDTLFPPEAEQRQISILQALDMAPQDTNLRQAEIDALVENVLGFYDHDTKNLVVITEKAHMGVGDRITYAHEFTHSMQDQHYDLKTLFARTAGNADAEMALRALVEGDATLTMGLYARNYLTAVDKVNYMLEQIRAMELSSGVSGYSGPLVESAAIFPYDQGALFVGLLYRQGGWKQIAQAFQNPPRSTEQILHPLKYFQGEGPVPVKLPNLAAKLGPEWKMLTEDTLGELYMRIYFEHHIGFDLAIPTSAGWGGDRYQVLSDSQGRLAFALLTAWDTGNDAQQFFEEYNNYVGAVGGSTATILENNVAHLRWQLPGRQFYVARNNQQVLVLHAPDGTTLDTLLKQFTGF